MCEKPHTTFLPRLNSSHCQLNARRVYQKKKLLGEICLIDDLCIEVIQPEVIFGVQ